MNQSHKEPDPRYPIGTYLNLTADELLKGQDLKGVVMAFLGTTRPAPDSGWNQLAHGVGPRIRIRHVSINEIPYRAGRLELPELPKPYLVTAKPVQPSIPEWNKPEVA